MNNPINFVVTIFLGLILLHGSLSQNVTISHPKRNSKVTAGSNLTVVLEVQSTTSSVNPILFSTGFKPIAFSTGFKTTQQDDPTSLGYPYVSTVIYGKDATLNPADRTYTYTISVPHISKFTQGDRYYITVAQYYLLGATNTPALQLTESEVVVEK